MLHSTPDLTLGLSRLFHRGENNCRADLFIGAVKIHESRKLGIGIIHEFKSRSAFRAAKVDGHGVDIGRSGLFSRGSLSFAFCSFFSRSSGSQNRDISAGKSIISHDAITAVSGVGSRSGIAVDCNSNIFTAEIESQSAVGSRPGAFNSLLIAYVEESLSVSLEINGSGIIFCGELCDALGQFRLSSIGCDHGIAVSKLFGLAALKRSGAAVAHAGNNRESQVKAVVAGYLIGISCLIIAGCTVSIFNGKLDLQAVNTILLDRLPGALHEVNIIAGVGSKVRYIVSEESVAVNNSRAVLIEVAHEGSVHLGSTLAFFSIDANELIALQFFSFWLFRRCRGGCGGRCGLGLTAGSESKHHHKCKDKGKCFFHFHFPPKIFYELSIYLIVLHKGGHNMNKSNNAEHNSKGNGKRGIAAEERNFCQHIGQRIGCFHQVVGKTDAVSHHCQNRDNTGTDAFPADGNECAAQHHTERERIEHSVILACYGILSGGINNQIGQAADESYSCCRKGEPETDFSVFKHYFLSSFFLP